MGKMQILHSILMFQEEYTEHQHTFCAVHLRSVLKSAFILIILGRESWLIQDANFSDHVSRRSKSPLEQKSNFQVIT